MEKYCKVVRMSEDQLAGDIARGHQAQRLLEDEFFAGVIATMKAEYMLGWERSNPGDADAREKMWVLCNALGNIQKELQKIAADGRVAQSNLDYAIKQKALRVV